MVASANPNTVRFGFLGVCEGVMIGVFAGWWLQTHHQPPLVYFGAGVALAGLYFLILNIAQGNTMSAPIVILSMIVWGLFGWHLGGYLHQILPVARFGFATVDSVMVWRIVGSLLFALIAYSDKTQIREI